MRFFGALLLACGISLGLFWLMQWLIAPPVGGQDRPEPPPAIQVMHLDKPPPPESEAQANAGGGASAPPNPPPVPGIDRPSGIAIPAPKTDSDLALPELQFKADLSSKTGLGQSFGGFAAGGSGGGAGGGSGGGYGDGNGKGRGGGQDLIPLSTARPQIPKQACDRKIEGYAVAEFNVTPRGKVTNVRIVDAKPRGLFERPMVESLENWLYQSNDRKKAFAVTWRFDFKLKDCKLNWD